MNDLQKPTQPDLTDSLPLSAVSFQFLYQTKHNQEFAKEFTSTKTNMLDAMQDFLQNYKGKRLYDIDEEVEVTYSDKSQKMIQIDARQDWDLEFYFVYENQMISRYSVQKYNGR